MQKNKLGPGECGLHHPLQTQTLSYGQGQKNSIGHYLEKNLAHQPLAKGLNLYVASTQKENTDLG